MLSVDGLAIFFFAVIPALSYRTDLVYPLKCPTGQDSALCNSESGFVAILESGAERLGVGVFKLRAGGKVIGYGTIRLCKWKTYEQKQYRFLSAGQ